MAPWRWSALRRPAAVALGIAMVAAVVGVSDTPRGDALSHARVQSAQGPSQAGITATPQASAAAQASATPAATRLPTDLPGPPERVGGANRTKDGSASTPPPVGQPPVSSSRGPEGGSSNVPPSDAESYVPTDAQLLAPAGRYVSVRNEVRIRFDLPVRHRTAFEEAFRLEPAVGGKLDWVDPRTMRFRPEGLAYGATYRVRVATGAREGEGGKEWQWTFTTMRKVTFTFDDCPSSPAAAQDLLAFLRQRHITAITFPTGKCARQYPWLVPALLADGHRVCNHTYSHADLPKLTDPLMSAEIAGGVHAGCNLLRPPYGDWDGHGGRVERVAAQQGYTLQFWDVDTLDWTGLSGQAIVGRIYDGGGGVVLMHFQGRHTLEALKLLDIAALTGQA